MRSAGSDGTWSRGSKVIQAGGGLEYAYWVTIPWGLGLAAHIAAYLVDRRRTGHTGTPHPAT